MVLGTKQDSNVSTLGGSAVAGRGEVLGLRALVSLPAGKNFFQSVSFGLDYKHFDQDVTLAPGVAPITAPITYYPLSVNYNGTWIGKNPETKKGSITEFSAGLTFHIRGLGSSPAEFENSRFKADGSFASLRGDLAHTHDLPGGFQAYGKLQGQISSQPLVSSEQFSAGGLGTARGYLEGEVAGIMRSLARWNCAARRSSAGWVKRPANGASMPLRMPGISPSSKPFRPNSRTSTS